MYTFGVIMNGTMYAHGKIQANEPGSWLPCKGYDFWTWCLLANYAFMGLLTSFIMKYLDNIQKLLMAGASMYVSTFATSTLFKFTPSISFVMGLLMVTAALFTYHWDKCGGKIDPLFPRKSAIWIGLTLVVVTLLTLMHWERMEPILSGPSAVAMTTADPGIV